MLLVVWVMGMLQSILDYLKIQESLPQFGFAPWRILLGVLIFLSIVFALTLWLKKKAFPHLGFLGPKKDAQGNYWV